MFKRVSLVVVSAVVIAALTALVLRALTEQVGRSFAPVRQTLAGSSAMLAHDLESGGADLVGGVGGSVCCVVSAIRPSVLGMTVLGAGLLSLLRRLGFLAQRDRLPQE